MDSFKSRHEKLIMRSGGRVSNSLFVEEVGVLLTKKSSVTNEALSLFKDMNLDSKLSETEQHSEFNSRLTYMSFRDEEESSKSYNEKMIKDFGHRGVYNDEIVTFLIAGSSIETMLEFIAHNEAKVSRLTSSKTAAQDYPLYRLRVKGLSEEFIKLQKNIINNFEESRLKNRELIEKCNPLEREIFNVLNLGCKAVSFTITMSIKDWHKTLIGRLSNHGVESEMIEILETVTEKLILEYPYFFNTKEEYFKMGNDKKYE